MSLGAWNKKPCKFGKLKNPSKGRGCRRRPKKAKRRCAKGIVKYGPRKGKCKKVQR